MTRPLTPIHKPIYDPFAVFQPTKTLIKECIKNLNQQCYEIQNEQREACQLPDWLAEFVQEQLEARSSQLISRIRSYHWYLKNFSNGSQLNQSTHSLTQADVERAKGIEIRGIYIGQLRQVGSRLLGKCPFHAGGQERTPSFIIDNNNRYHCFACNIDGDSIEFVKKNNSLDFMGAVRYLINI